jgi:PiT family inorganic phosphate transporter
MTLLLFVIFLALAFDYINGFHDAANSIATVVSTKVLSPFQAVIWAAFFNAVVFFLCKHHLFGFELKVADSVSKIVKTEAITLVVIVAGLTAAIFWNLLTWYYGIPSSSSHTLMGGFAGAAIAKAGFGVLADVGKIYTTVAFIFLAPLIGMILGYFIAVLILHLFKRSNPHRAERIFKKLQLVSSAAFSLGHGANDAQKVMGIIAAALMVYAHTVDASMIPAWAQVDILQEMKNGKMINKISHIPDWVQIACFTAIGLGTLSGGWRIIKTMGTKITKVTPLEGVAAETAGAITLYGTQLLGIPVSTTHTITGSIIGVGVTKGLSAVKWGITISLLWAWVLTIPVSAAMGALSYVVLRIFLGA